MKYRCILLLNLLLAPLVSLPAADASSTQPFGTDYPELDSLATGKWWTKSNPPPRNVDNQPPPPPMDVPRDQVVAFALYTVHGGVLKMTAQLYPLKPGEPREARLEVQRDGAWVEIAKSEVLYPGWDAHFRVEKWDATKDATKDVAYRVRHGETALFEGLIRRAWAVHLCGDQHLAVVVKHGIREFSNGHYGFTNPALVNTIYGRWWHPLDEKPGPNPVPGSPLPWTGDFKDGLGSKLSMLAYADPANITDEKQRADGYGIALQQTKAHDHV